MACVHAFSGDILLRMVRCFVCVTQTEGVVYFTLENVETCFIHFEKTMVNI